MAAGPPETQPLKGAWSIMTNFSIRLGISIFSLTLVFATPALANVVRTANPSTGRPVAAYSNPGSAQASLHRSATGTTNKSSHDGYRVIW